jgi:hypothetical protein
MQTALLQEDDDDDDDDDYGRHRESGTLQLHASSQTRQGTLVRHITGVRFC